MRPLNSQDVRRARWARVGATQLRNRIHAVVADFGYDRAGTYRTGPGRGWLAELDLPAAPPEIVTDWLAVIPGPAPVIERLDGELRQCYVAFTSRIAGPLRLSLGTRGWTHVRSS